MTAAELVRIATAALFVVVFVAAAARAVRSPRRANVDTLLLVAAFSWVLVSSYVAAAAGLGGRVYTTVNVALLLAIPLLTLRLVDDHVGVPRVALVAALAGWLGSVVLIASGPEQIPPGVALVAVAYFALAQGYAAWRTVEASRRARGVTRRRLLAVAAGSGLIALAIVAAGGALLLPVLAILPSPLALAAASAYFLGFTTPATLRRAWQAPEVLRFLGLASRLAQGVERDAALREVAGALAAVTGAEQAAVGVWDEEHDTIEVHPALGEPFTRPARGLLLGSAVHGQRALMVAAGAGEAPGGPFGEAGMRSALAAPATLGGHRWGAVAVYARRESLFADDDLALVELLASQVAELLENRRLVEEVRDLNRSLHDRVVELRSLNEELSSFAYSVSHDLRAPLRAIDGFSQVLLEDKAEAVGPDGRHHLQRVRNAAQRMEQLIDDLLKLSRTSRDELHVEELDLGKLAADIAEEQRGGAPGRDVDFRTAQGATVRADPRLLRIALENLLANSWKFTRPRDPAHVEFGVADNGDGPAFFVRDDGVGFDMAYAANLFGPFQRLHRQSEFEGTGIGLATVQRIVHRHGGRIWAESAPDRGTTVYFTLPNRSDA